MSNQVMINAAVEGILDEAVATQLIAHAGGKPGQVYVKNGKPALCQRINGYNKAAVNTPWLVLVDLDRDADCAPPFCNRWLPEPSPRMCFRVAVRAVEAWLLADAEALATFLGVARGKVPAYPETLPDPKETMVNLARDSRRREVRADMVPGETSGRRVGPAYTSRMIEFVDRHWRPAVAAESADSLARAIRCLRRLAEGRS